MAGNTPDVIRFEATEMGPPQTFVWFNGLVALDGFCMDVIEVGITVLAVPEKECEKVAVIPGTIFAF